MTAKEKLLVAAPTWSEAQAERALRAAEMDAAEFGRWLAEHPVDDDLEAMLDATNDEMLDELAADERQAGFGTRAAPPVDPDFAGDVEAAREGFGPPHGAWPS